MKALRLGRDVSQTVKAIDRSTTPEAQHHRHLAFLLKLVVFLTVNHRRPPPLEGISLHRRNKECGETLGDLEPVYDLFTITSEFTLPEAVTQTCGDIFVKQVVFLTVNHRGPLPVRELHSTEEAIVWRDPGGS